MIPTVKEIQNSITHLTNMVLEVSKGIAWPQEYAFDDSREKGRPFHISTQSFINHRLLKYDQIPLPNLHILVGRTPIILCCVVPKFCVCLLEGEKVNFHPRVIKNEDITNVLKILSKAVISQEGHMKDVLKKFEPFRELWDKDRELKYEVDSCTCLHAVK